MTGAVAGHATIVALDNPTQNYAWGSPTIIPQLLGRPATGEPVAELWLGAHPAAPSITSDGRSLDAVLAAQPGLLGADVVRRFGQLPFLLKVLAVERPLSLQAHPTKAQAKLGFAAENAAGIALDAPDRNYKDANHKPEQVCALTAFEGLCGFRPAEQTVRFFVALQAPALAEFTDRLVADGGLRDVVTDLLARPRAGIERILAEVVPAAARLADTGGEWAAEAGWIVRLQEHYPADRGTVIALLLNLVRLEPGQALFLHAGELHAYLRGTAVELLANSDNVLRGGLTPKHIDVAALLSILEFVEDEVEPIAAGPVELGVREYPSPVPDFGLARLEVGPTDVQLPSDGPRILLCTDGAALVCVDAEQVALGRGAGVFVAAGNAVSVRPATPGEAATVYAARPNLPPTSTRVEI